MGVRCTVTNTAMFYSKSDLNDFTTALRDRCTSMGQVMVELRDGSYRKVIWRPGSEEDDELAAFRTEDYSMLWELDGSSVTSRDLDIVRMEW